MKLGSEHECGTKKKKYYLLQIMAPQIYFNFLKLANAFLLLPIFCFFLFFISINNLAI